MSADKDAFYYQNHKLVLTRDAEACHDLALDIQAKNPRIDMIFSPILDVEKVVYALPALHPDAAVITTSKNAESIRQKYADALHYGIGTVPEIQDVASLVNHIETHHEKTRPLVYLRGHDVSFDLTQDLRAKGYLIEEHIVYKAHLATSLTPQFLTALDAGEIAYISFFSARTAAGFVALLPVALRAKLESIKALCLSAGVVNSLSELPWQECLVTPNKSRAAMVELIQTLYESD